MHGVADLCHHLQPFTRIQMMLFGISSASSTDELHGEVGLRPETRIGRAGFVDLRDAGMLQPAQRLRLLFETAQQLRGRDAGLDDLEGDDPGWSCSAS